MIFKKYFFMSNIYRDAILGVVVGDALGVPVEFMSRERLKAAPIKDMVGYGTYNQPPGTWSDDSSLTLCLAEELSKEFNIRNFAFSFVNWLYYSYWTPYNEVFDVGNTTEAAIRRLEDGISPQNSGETGVTTNGNGSLMRILPLLFYVYPVKDDLERYEIIRKVSAITHAHPRSTLSCFYYLEFARFILQDYSPKEAYKLTNKNFSRLTQKRGTSDDDIQQFERLLSGQIDALKEQQIKTDTYVVYTLEAAVWCILNTNNYRDAVLKAVNLGKDTDTTAAVTGGLAGLIYSANAIPEKWLDKIARLEDIEDVAERLCAAYG
jgi:ADP-ribosylglycohydrolase